MTSALIAAEDTGTLEKTFKKYEEEQDAEELSVVLAYVAIDEARMPKVINCLRIAYDPFPKNEMCVSYLVNRTLLRISDRINAKSFTNVITYFKPGDIKLLVAILHRTVWRGDAVDVLKSVVDTFPELMTQNLPSWLASHRFDQNSGVLFISLVKKPLNI